MGKMWDWLSTSLVNWKLMNRQQFPRGNLEFAKQHIWTRMGRNVEILCSKSRKNSILIVHYQTFPQYYKKNLILWRKIWDGLRLVTSFSRLPSDRRKQLNRRQFCQLYRRNQHQRLVNCFIKLQKGLDLATLERWSEILPKK